MKVVVMKFGGAAVATPQQFAKIAKIIAERSRGSQVVAVVSAMGDTTDKLLSLARDVHPEPPLREQDMLVTVGERISIALLAMALNLEGKEGISFTGSQSGIITTVDHSNAKILDVKPRRILKALEEGKVAIVAGFQGVSLEGEITTLGRGGSDTTAVALGIALGAECVEFYKDVQGVYSQDPKMCQEAVFYPSLSYEGALQILERGSGILHSRAVLLAQKNNTRLHVRSFEDPFLQKHQGTVIGSLEGGSEDEKMYE